LRVESEWPLTAIIASIDAIDIVRLKLKRKVSAMEARKRLGELLEGVYYRGDEVVIERAGKPMAVVIPSARYEAVQRNEAEAKKRFMELLEKNWEKNKDVPPDVIERDIEEAIREVRARERAKAAKSG
jgi:prevent-host-death family protein